MTGLMEKIRTTQRARRTDAETRYRQAVREAAAGKELDPADVLEVLEEVGRDAEEFARDVDTVVHRAQLRAQLATAPNLKAELASLEREWQTAAAAFAAVRKEYQDRAFQWHHRKKDLSTRIREAEATREALREGCPDESLKQRAAHLLAMFNATGEELQREKGLLSSHRAKLEDLEYKAKQSRDGLYTEELEATKARIGASERKIAELQAALAELEAASAANDEAMRNA